MNKIGREKRQHALENAAERDFGGDPLDDIEVHPDRRMHESDFHRAYEKDAKPDWRQTKVGNERQ